MFSIAVRHKEAFDSHVPAGVCLGQAPTMNPTLFVGRELEMRRIEHVLHSNNGRSPHRLAIFGGKGGIGKTQLAIAYTMHYRRHYDSVFWLDTPTEATLKASFGSIAMQIFDMRDLDALQGDQTHVKIAR